MIYFIHLLVYLDIYFIVAMSLNIAVGYCGILALSQAGFFGIGAYVYALSVPAVGWGLLPACALARIDRRVLQPRLVRRVVAHAR